MHFTGTKSSPYIMLLLKHKNINLACGLPNKCNKSSIKSNKPFKTNGISHRYQFEQSISIYRDVGWHLSFFVQIFIENSAIKHWKP